jgi:Tfp pilus assembly protein PilX
MANIGNNKGIVLFIVLMTFLIVVILANIMLGIMSSQSRLTHHQVSRIQAYYADYGAMNYAFDKIRRMDWPMPTPGTSYPRMICAAAGPGCTDIEVDLPRSVANVLITVSSRGVNNCNPPGDVPYCIRSVSTYTYTP